MMYYDDYCGDEYEPTQEEQEELEGMESTEVDVKKDVLEIKFDAENFARGIVSEVVSAVKKDLYKEVVKEIKDEVLDDIRQDIKCATGDIVRGIIQDFMDNEKIQIGGTSVWDDEPKEELTLTQYSKRCMKDCIEKSRFRIVKGFKKDRYSRNGLTAETQEYSFEEYLMQHLGIDDEVRTYLDSQINEVRRQVNESVKAAFDQSTKEMLSNTVLQVLMSNDTYKKIESNISCIADRPAHTEEAK